MRILAGCSGYAYKPWKGSFYPEDLPDSGMFAYYVSQLPSVEINNTFYRMPNRAAVEKWVRETPEGFRLVLKASRRITHNAKLADVGELLQYLFEVTAPLGAALGAHLFQLPPYLRKDVPLLAAFLEQIPVGQRVALEFRHASWFDDEVFAALRSRDAALVVADAEKLEVPFVATAAWGYLRLRRDSYTDAEMQHWADRVAEQEWSEAYVFFKHEDEGAAPRLARQFLQVAGEGGVAGDRGGVGGHGR